MKIIGLTGGIATGKSLIAERLYNLGYEVFDADKAVSDFYNDPLQLDKIEELFGVTERSKIREIVFADKVMLKKLEDIIHPYVRGRVSKFIAQNKDFGKELVFLDVPLLYEGTLWKLCDAVIYLTAEDKIREERFLARGKGDLSLFEKIKNSQFKQSDIMHHKPFVINNSSTIDSAYQQLEQILEKLRNA